jgi:hypothetical protein
MNVKIPQRAGSKNRDDQKDSKRRVTIFHINAAGATSHRSARAQPAVQPAALALKGSIHQTKPRLGNGEFNASFDTASSSYGEQTVYCNRVFTKENNRFVPRKVGLRITVTFRGSHTTLLSSLLWSDAEYSSFHQIYLRLNEPYKTSTKYCLPHKEDV